MTATHHVLAISGSLRGTSTSSAVVRTAARWPAPDTTVTVFGRLGELPHFNPDLDAAPLPPEVSSLRAAVATADSVLLSTPEYAGALPGSFKNLLDWMVGGVELGGKPVGWVNCSVSPTGAVAAHEDLRRVLGFVDADVVDAACADIPVPRAAVDGDGLVTDPALRTRIAAVVGALAAHAPQRATTA
jgi:NAD(P)H-dependent FMN reductase